MTLREFKKSLDKYIEMNPDMLDKRVESLESSTVTIEKSSFDKDFITLIG